MGELHLLYLLSMLRFPVPLHSLQRDELALHSHASTVSICQAPTCKRCTAAFECHL
jgi:hypothetical protein